MHSVYLLQLYMNYKNIGSARTLNHFQYSPGNEKGGKKMPRTSQLMIQNTRVKHTIINPSSMQHLLPKSSPLRHTARGVWVFLIRKKLQKVRKNIV